MSKKLKTHKSTAKRFKVTGSGKVMRDKQQNKNNSHLRNQRKSTRKVDQSNLGVSKGTEKRIKKLLNL